VKIIRYIFTIVITIYGLSVSARQADTLNSVIPKETKIIDSVSFDAKTYDQLKKDKQYDYYHLKPEHSFFDSIIEALNTWLSLHLNLHIGLKGVKTIFWIITILVLLAILVILYLYKPSLFYINRKKKHDFEIEDEDINSTDFEKLIKEAYNSGQYSDAIRWTYLLTLKRLYQKELISWDANKTVNEYVYELKKIDLKPDFKELSQLFLYYRYGNFEASKDAFDSFTALSNNIIKRL
jgi:uncharacterized membrane protein